MKNLTTYSILVIIHTLIFMSCSTADFDNSIEKSYEGISLFEKTEFAYNDTLRIHGTNNNYVDLRISSDTKNALLDFIADFNFCLTDFKMEAIVDNFQDNIKSNSIADIAKGNTRNIFLEVVETSDNLENYTIGFRGPETNLKSWYPPNQYYIGYKAKIKGQYLHLKYIYLENDYSGLMWKWGYTNSWLGSWYWDNYWRVHAGSYIDVWIAHPLNNIGKYRLGLSLYTNFTNNFDISESIVP